MIHILLAAVIAHSGQVLVPQTSTLSLKPEYGSVLVKDCSGETVRIYADSKMTTPLPNPFVSDKNGDYLYFSTETYDDVRVVGEGSRYYVRIVSCPVVNWRKK
jgi:hypothetical protein